MNQPKVVRFMEWAYFYGFCFTLCVLFFSFFIASLFNAYYPLSQNTIHYIELGGLIFDGTALYGVINLTARTLSGLVTQEKMNHTFLLTCVTIGLLFWFVSHFLKPVV